MIDRYCISSDKARALTLLIATAATTLATATAATAAPITYDLVGASAQTITGDAAQFTGTFTYDPTTVTLEAADIVGLFPFAVFPQTYDTPQSATQTAIEVAGPTSTLTIEFANPLAAQPDQITAIDPSTLFNATGSAVPASVPEPSGFALLVGVVGFFLLSRRLVRL